MRVLERIEFERSTEIWSQSIVGWLLRTWFEAAHVAFDYVPGMKWLCGPYCILAMKIDNEWFPYRTEASVPHPPKGLED